MAVIRRHEGQASLQLVATTCENGAVAEAAKARKSVSFGRAGGSRTVVLPKAWLDELGMDDRVDIVLTDEGIVIERPPDEAGATIEDDAHFAAFLEFILADALRHPEELVPADELLARGRRLTAGVEIQD